MNRRHLVLPVLLLAVTPLPGAGPPKLETRSLTVVPAAAPTPALKYVFLPELRDQTTGNAVMFYHRALALPSELPEGHAIWKWFDMPVKDLPLKEVRNFLDSHSLLFDELDKAARCERCDWEMADNLRREGFNLVMEDVSRVRRFGQYLDLRARYEIAERQVDKALATIGTGLTMARHVNTMPTVISSLIGAAISSMMMYDLAQLIEVPDAPNLYWALTHLPAPFIDVRRGLETERMMAATLIPALKSGRLGDKPPPMSEAEIQELIKQLQFVLAVREVGVPETQLKLGLIVQTAKGYPAARRALAGQGWTEAELDRLPMLQTVLLHAIYEYNRFFDEFFKWHDLPYWQAEPGREQAEAAFLKAVRSYNGSGIPLTRALMPGINRVYNSTMRVDRQIAFLRCHEAIRLYAAANNGKLPARLDDIKEVPVPVDPRTGKNFDYSVDGETFILFAPPPAGQSPPVAGDYIRYQVKMKR